MEKVKYAWTLYKKVDFFKNAETIANEENNKNLGRFTTLIENFQISIILISHDIKMALI